MTECHCEPSEAIPRTAIIERDPSLSLGMTQGVSFGFRIFGLKVCLGLRALYFEFLYMQFHQIKSIHREKSKKRVGRGGKRGTYSGRGIKGQKARAGAKIRPAWRDLIKQIPKRRGVKFKPLKEKPRLLNLGILNKFFKDGEIVSINSLLEKKLISKIKGRAPEIKILGEGEINKKLTFKGLAMSKGARRKIEKAGGSII